MRMEAKNDEEEAQKDTQNIRPGVLKCDLNHVIHLLVLMFSLNTVVNALWEEEKIFFFLLLSRK